jgi:hypothetical protein
MKIAAQCSLVFSLMAAPMSMVVAQSAPDSALGVLRGGDYRNAAYGYIVKIPHGVQYEMTRESNPNQGFLIPRAPGGHIVVDASHTDSELLAQLVAEQRELYVDCRETAHANTKLGRLPALALDFACPKGVGMGNPSIVRMVVALRCEKGHSCIAYRVESFTNQSDARKQTAASIGWLVHLMRRGFTTRAIQ